MRFLAFEAPAWFAKVLAALTWLKDAFVAMGPSGAFLMAFVDSFVPIPAGTDFAVVTLSASSPPLAPLVVFAAAAGATAGSTGIYLGARRAGLAALRRFSEEKRSRVENVLGRYDILAMMVAGIAPPPFPFKLFNLAAGAFRMPLWRFVTGIFLGRAARFAIEAILAVQYGDEAMEIVKRRGPAALALVLFVAAVVVGTRAWLTRRRPKADGPAAPSED